MGIIKKIFGNKEAEKNEAELKAAVLKKATENRNANKESAASEEKAGANVASKSSPVYEIKDKDKKKNIHAVLLEIANKGEMGALPISIADKTGINQQDTSTALSFLTKKQYVQEVNSTTGFKYYLTPAGKKHCISKEFNCN